MLAPLTAAQSLACEPAVFHAVIVAGLLFGMFGVAVGYFLGRDEERLSHKAEDLLGRLLRVRERVKAQ